MGVKLEALGGGMALACAVHCVTLPLMTGVSACVHESPWGGAWVEAGMLGTTGLIGYASLGFAFRRHGRRLPLALLTTGLGLMLGAQQLHAGPASTAGTVLGALVVVAAQVTNRRSGCCGDPERTTRRDQRAATEG